MDTGWAVWTSNERNRLIAVRRARGLSQTDLAELLAASYDVQTSQTGISSIERGKTKRPEEQLLAALLQFVETEGVNVPDLSVASAVRDAGTRIQHDDDSNPLSAEQRSALRDDLIAHIVSLISTANRDRLKLVRQTAVWAGLPIDQLTDDIGDFLSEPSSQLPE